MKIALIQLNPVIGDFRGNLARILAWLAKARARGCALAILPELALSGYPPQDFLERPAFVVDNQKALESLVSQAPDLGVVCGTVTRNPEPTGKPLHNSAVLFANGRILATVNKQLLPTYDVFDESRYFEPGSPAGPSLFQGLRLGITICEDVWNDKKVFAHPLYSKDPVGELVASTPGPDILINIAASPFNLGKSRVRREIFANIGSSYRLPALYVNQVGGQDCLVFDGASQAQDHSGRVVAQARRFEEDMVVVDTESWQGELHEPPADDHDRAERERVLAALVLGTRDYVKKCGFSRVVVGLSGGIDSALTAVIASRALGEDQVLGVAMPSPYTSKASLEDARILANNLGIEFARIPIDEIFASYLEGIAPLLGRAPGDITEQNIQARIRGNLLMAIANRQGRLVLSTGNKSEMAVGYCTLYGDMSGGLAVISDVPKLMVYELARLINQEREIIPVRSIERPPSAELAPGQKDEDDLPPYRMLDPILQAYLEENRSIEEIAAMGFPRPVVEEVVRRVRRNEYKRKQAPVGIKVTTKAFGYGRRYPTAERYQEGNW